MNKELQMNTRKSKKSPRSTPMHRTRQMNWTDTERSPAAESKTTSRSRARCAASWMPVRARKDQLADHTLGNHRLSVLPATGNPNLLIFLSLIYTCNRSFMDIACVLPDRALVICLAYVCSYHRS